jgi:3-hydroxyisobutyrate dehydrogenase
VVNAWVVMLNSGIAEVVTLARGFDLRPEEVLETFAGGPLDSGYAQAKARLMLGQDFEAAFPLKHARKDAQLALATTDRELPVLEGVTRQLERAEALGYGDDDMAATICGLADVPARAD